MCYQNKTMAESNVKIEELNETIEESNEIIGESNEKTFSLTKFHEVSFNGIPVAILKTFLQRYARVNNLEKGLWCLVELDLFSLVEDSTQFNSRNATSVRSEMINKLISMVTTDVGIAVWDLPLTAKLLYEKWMKTKNTEESRLYLVELYGTICKSPKSKLIEDIKLIYRLPPYTNDFYIHQQFLEKYQKNLYIKLYKIPKTYNDIKLSFESCLITPTLEVFTHLSKIMLIRENLPNFEKNNLVSDIWFIINKNSHQFTEVISSLHYFYKRMHHKDKYLFIYHAILIIIYRNQIVLEKNEKFTFDDILVIYAPNLLKEKIEFDFLWYTEIANEDKVNVTNEDKLRQLSIAYKKFL